MITIHSIKEKGVWDIYAVVFWVGLAIGFVVGWIAGIAYVSG